MLLIHKKIKIINTYLGREIISKHNKERKKEKENMNFKKIGHIDKFMQKKIVERLWLFL